MAKYLKPRRGTAANAVAQSIILKSGELFLEIPTGTTMGKTPGRIVIGDGVTSYNNINYASTVTTTFKPFITDPSLYTPIFNNSTYASSNWVVRDGNTAIDKIGNGNGTVNLPSIVSAVKETLCKHNDSINALNSNISGYASSISNVNQDLQNTKVKVTTNTNNIANLQTSVSTLSGNSYGIPRMKYHGHLSNATQTRNFINEHGIDSGEFTDLELGDYVTITYDDRTIKLYVAGLDWYRGYSNHSVLLFPDQAFEKGIALYPSTATANGGFYNSTAIWGRYDYDHIVNGAATHIDGAADIFETKIKAILGEENLLKTSVYYGSNISTSAYNQGISNTFDGATVDTRDAYRITHVPSEIDIMGYSVLSSSPRDHGIWANNGRIPLFNLLNPAYFYTGTYGFWTRSFGFYYEQPYSQGTYKNYYYIIFEDYIRSEPCTGGNMHPTNSPGFLSLIRLGINDS